MIVNVAFLLFSSSLHVVMATCATGSCSGICTRRIIRCGDTPTVMNGTFSVLSDYLGDQASLTCDTDFIAVPSIITCRVNGQWSDAECLTINEMQFTSCLEVYNTVMDAENGSYTLQNNNGETYTVYCEFYPTHIYTYPAVTNLTSLNINDLFNNKMEVLIRLGSGAVQKEARIAQIEKYRDLDISIQYNSNVGYNPIINPQMGPYLYVALLPIVGINHLGDRQGYRANGQDFLFTNCDGNQNSYFVLLYNVDGALYDPKASVGITYSLAWVDVSETVDSGRLLADEFFAEYEQHMGGCGGYIISSNLPLMMRMTFGLRSDFVASSCKDIYDYYVSVSTFVVNGVYYLKNGQGDTYQVYCEFDLDQGTIYTFIAPTSLTFINIDDLYNNQHEFLLRYRLNTGMQRQSTIRQLTSLSSEPLSIQYNSSIDHNPIINQQMGPYVYIGLLPTAAINQFDTQGYNVNGVNYTFVNCDGNENHYFALLFNAARASPTSKSGVTPLIRQWITGSDPVPAGLYLPANFFTFFEIHMGGCGGYITLPLESGMEGVTFGLRYDLPTI